MNKKQATALSLSVHLHQRQHAGCTAIQFLQHVAEELRAGLQRRTPPFLVEPHLARKRLLLILLNILSRLSKSKVVLLKNFRSDCQVYLQHTKDKKPVSFYSIVGRLSASCGGWYIYILVISTAMHYFKMCVWLCSCQL